MPCFSCFSVASTCYSLILNGFCLFFKSFSSWRIIKLCSSLLFCFNQTVIFLWLQDIHIYQLYPTIMPIFLLLLCYYCILLSSLILSTIVMIRFYLFSKRFSLKLEELSNARVESVNKNEYGFYIKIHIHKILKVNIWWTIKCNLLKLLLILGFP